MDIEVKPCFAPADVSALEARTGLVLTMNWTHSWPEGGDTVAGQRFLQWLKTNDGFFRAQQGAGTPPIWIDDWFHERWGPHPWPVRWEDVATMEAVDCGVLQALTTAVYQMRGVTAHPVQLVLCFNEVSIAGWRAVWESAGLESRWCGHGVAYHEGTLVVDDETGEGKIYDPMGRFFLRPRPPPGYERIIAFRYQADTIDTKSVLIEGVPAHPGVWYEVPDEV